MKINFYDKFIPEGLPCDTKQWFTKGQPTSITIHWIGPYPHQTPDIVRNWWIISKGNASAHYIIKDNECMRCWPEGKIAWHAGHQYGNASSIGIEVVPKNVEGEFSEASIETLRELLKKLPKLPLVRHFDWTQKHCPKYYMDDNKWEELKKRLT